MNQELFELRDRMETILKSVGIPYKKMIVIVGGDIHIDCIGKDTRDKWVSLLHKFCKKVCYNDTLFENKVNKRTVLLPTVHKGFTVHGSVRGI